jgi:hypothetical protein
MKLDEKALKRSMENAKKNFNKACDGVVNFVKKLNKSVDAFKEEFNEERPCCGGHCHCNHDADGDHVCHCHEEIEPKFDLEDKDEE